MKSLALASALLAFLALHANSQSFVHWESPHVHPLDLTPSGARLLAVNTADARLEVFDAAGSSLIALPAIPVGIDPVSVRAYGETEAWVVNHISDSVSIVDLVTGRVRATLRTADEPCDVVFAGNPVRAFVSCSQANLVQVFDPQDLHAAPLSIAIDAEDPRALAVSPDGRTVYAAIFESGNATTILSGDPALGVPPDAVSHPDGPHGGLNPFPNDGAVWDPPLNPLLPPPPPVDLIVRKDDLGRWLDDTGADWTEFVSGKLAEKSGRVVGWNMPDRDVAVIDTQTLGVSYITRLMNQNMAIAVRPDGAVTVVGADATNERRYEPKNKGTFLRLLVATIGDVQKIRDLNPQLAYDVPQVEQALRDLALGDPRGIAWSADSSVGYVTGMGSNNLLPIDGLGYRITTPIEVGEGPTGVVFDELNGRVFVLNKFESSISVVDPALELEAARIAFHDPSPPAIRLGRKFLYDTHATSGLGQVSCASCHVDARMDRLAWDLGDPAGSMGDLVGLNLGANLPAFTQLFYESPHPMKGPMTTQTLQDIVGNEPFHWRGDKNGLEEFNNAYLALHGDDQLLTPAEMQQFEDFLATIYFPPNPYRNLDGSLPTDLPLPGHFTTGEFGPAGEPLPNGNARHAFDHLFQPPHLFVPGVACITCHTSPSGSSTNTTWNGFGYDPIPPGPNGESHLAVIGSLLNSFTAKVPQLRNMHEKTGFNLGQLESNAGFGYRHSGSIDSLERFHAKALFGFSSDQEIADLVALMLCSAGGELSTNSGRDPLHPPAWPSKVTHAAIGVQFLLDAADSPLGLDIDQWTAVAESGAVGLIAKSLQAGESRGYAFTGSDTWQSDRLAAVESTESLKSKAALGAEVLFTIVPKGSETRLGIDCDQDGFFDRDELDSASDPRDAQSVPGPCSDPLTGPATGLEVTVRSATSLQLEWIDAGPLEDFYVVERALSGGSFIEVTMLPVDSTRFTDIGLIPDQGYEYRVVARNCAGDAASTTVSGRTPAIPLLAADVDSISLAQGGVQVLALEAGAAHAGELFLLIGTASGTVPGLPTSAGELPIQFDAYTNYTLTSPNKPPLTGSLSTLSTTGSAQVLFSLPPGQSASLAGVALHHAYATVSETFEITLVSNAQSLLLIP